MKRQDKYPETKTFHFHNQNPKGRLMADDCVARAISLATGKSWEMVIRECTEAAIRKATVFNDKTGYEAYLEAMGAWKRSQPRKKDRTKYTVGEFCQALNDVAAGKTVQGVCAFPSDLNGGSKVLVSVANHLTCLQQVDGLYKACDTWDCTGYTVGNFYIVKGGK